MTEDDTDMTANDDLRAAAETAQALLERCQDDLARLDDLLPLLEQTISRVHDLSEYYQGVGQEHLAALTADDPAAVVPPVLNEDAAWEVAAGLDDRLLRLLRIVTAEITSGLDTRH